MTDDGGWFGTAEAAAVLGLSERTVRRRAQSGALPARRVAAPSGQGGRGWAVWVAGAATTGQAGRTAAATAAATTGRGGQAETVQPAGQSDALVAALALVDRLTREQRDQQTQLLQLAGQVGYLQRQVQEQAALLALEPPRVDTAAPNGHHDAHASILAASGVGTAPQSSTAPARPWWRIWR